MAFSNSALFDTLRILAFGGISGTYAAAGVALAHPARAFRVVNNTDGDIFVAITNGSTPPSNASGDNLFVPAGSFVLYDVTSNSLSTATSLFALSKGDQFWIRQSSAPSVGNACVEVMSGKGE